MNKRLLTLHRSLVLLALGGSTLAIFGATFGAGIPGGGCNYSNYANYQQLYTDSGKAVIQSLSDNLFGKIGKDYDKWVRTPTTVFAQGVWGNFVDAKLPDDLPNNPVVKR